MRPGIFSSNFFSKYRNEILTGALVLLFLLLKDAISALL